MTHPILKKMIEEAPETTTAFLNDLNARFVETMTDEQRERHASLTQEQRQEFIWGMTNHAMTQIFGRA